MHVEEKKMFFLFWAKLLILTCIGCLGGGSLCVAVGTRCGQSQSLIPVCEVGTQRRWGARWTRWGPQEKTWDWGGWTPLTEIWKNTNTTLFLSI